MTLRPDTIDAFFAGRRLALVGVSVVPDDFTRVAMRSLRHRGYDLVPIRPGVNVIEGRRAYPTVFAVPGPLDGALIMTPPHHTERAVYDCAERGIQRFWLDPGGQRGVPEDAIELCRRRHLVIIVGGDVPIETLRERVRRESKQWLVALALSARLKAS